jgi:hypothetical protein
LATETTHPEPEIAEAESGQLLWRFGVGAHETGVDDPFQQWLHDDKPVRIDWSSFGIEKLYVEPTR